MNVRDIEESSREAVRVLRKGGFIYIIDQEEVAPFSLINNVAESLKLKLAYEKALSLVYDHGRTSKAVLKNYVMPAD